VIFLRNFRTKDQRHHQLLHIYNHHITTANIPTKVEYLSFNHIDSLQPVTFLQPVTTENFQKDKTSLFCMCAYRRDTVHRSPATIILKVSSLF